MNVPRPLTKLLM